MLKILMLMAIKNIFRLVKVWLRISFLAAESQLLTNFSGVLFLVGKFVKFSFFFLFFFNVLSEAGNLGIYSREQVILFFLVFNLVDIVTQFLFRGVYLFRFSVVNGAYDFDLLKPLPSYFRPVFGWTDTLDFITLIPLVTYLFYFVSSRGISSSPISWLLFLVLILNSLWIAFAFHLLICSVCILTLAIDHLVWIYRDLLGMARFPTDVYPRMVQSFLTFTIPVVVLITVPAKALMGILSWRWILLSLGVGVFSLWISFKFWHSALSRYSSASS